MRKPSHSFSRRALLLTSTAACAFSQVSAPSTPEKRFFERTSTLRKQDPDLVPRVRNQRGFPPEMNSLRWMLGTWNASAKAYATPSTPERVISTAGSYAFKTVPESGWIWLLSTPEGQGVPMPFIGYEPISKRYVMDLCGWAGCYGLMTSSGVQGNHITFEGEVTIFNISIHMRQTLSKTTANDSEMEIFNEERMSDRTWTPIDEYHLKRQE